MPQGYRPHNKCDGVLLELCHTHSPMVTWRVTCTTLTPSPTLPALTRMLPAGDSLDTTPAITAGSTQYFWPTVRMMGWNLSRYGISISASLSEARTPTATQKERWGLVWLMLKWELQRRGKIYSKFLGSSSGLRSPCLGFLKSLVAIPTTEIMIRFLGAWVGIPWDMSFVATSAPEPSSSHPPRKIAWAQSPLALS